MCLKNQRGFSLVQVLLLSAALSASALVAIQSFKTQKDEIKEADVKDRVEQIHNAVYSIFQNRNHCLATVVYNYGTAIAPNLHMPLNKIILANPTSPTPTVAFQIGDKYLYESVSIKDMEIVFPPDLKDPATFNITYNRSGNKRQGDTDVVPKSFKIGIQRSSPSQLNGCSSVTLANGAEAGNQDLTKQMCLSLPELYTWNDTLKLCQIKDSVCPTDRIFAGLDTSGNKICRPLFDYLPYLIDSTFTQSCPDDYDQIKFTRSPIQPYNKVSIECNKKNSTCPSVHSINWVDAFSVCYGFLPRGNDGAVYTATATNPPLTGSVDYKCNAGTWSQITTSKNCDAPCPATTLSWGGGKCSGTVPYFKNGYAYITNDTTPPSTGTAKFLCYLGNWSIYSGSTCRTDCKATSLPAGMNWTVAGNTCNAPVPDLADDGIAYSDVTDSVAPATGSARITCSNGSYTVAASPAATCTVPPTPGTCKWTTETTWENADCTGFQLSTLPSVAAPVPVPSPAACSAKCGVCMGSVSYNGCVFTPN